MVNACSKVRHLLKHLFKFFSHRFCEQNLVGFQSLSVNYKLELFVFLDIIGLFKKDCDLSLFTINI